MGVQQGNVTAYYLYNLQGDVVALADAATGKIIATYEYDAWGKCSVTNASGYSIGTANPFRYRGYYYDVETGLYYLNSRYYNPEVGRFLNADSFASTDVSGELSTNMFAYCENNPVVCYDNGGLYSFLCTELGRNPVTANTFTNKPKTDSKYKEIVNVSAGGGIGGYVGIDASLIGDDEGNYYLVTTFKVGGGVGGKVEALSLKDLIAFDTLSPIDVDNIYDLEGWSHSMGGTIGIVGIEWDGNTDPAGIDWSIATSLGADFHMTGNYTIVKQIYKSK